jgi:trimeric autotransporter adhesin
MRSRNPLTLFFVLAFVLLAYQLSFGQYGISSVAGGGPNGLTELSASVGYPGSIALDASGNIYIADPYSNHIFEVTAATGILTIVAGNGTRGYSGDGGLATAAALNGPEGVFVDGSGNIFIADTENCLVREVSGGNITTVAGSSCGYSGDGGPATSAQLDSPYGVFVDGSGNIFVADTFNSAIRKVAAGAIETVAGNGTTCADPTTACGDGGTATSAQLDLPEGVFTDGAGNIFIADTDSSRIRVVNTGTAPITIANTSIPAGDIQTVAGAYYDSSEGSACQDTGDNGAATAAYLCGPAGVFVDSSEDIYVADTSNFAIREVVTSGSISTIAGTLGTPGYSGDGGPATSAELNYPNAVFVDASADIFIADTDNFVIREVTAGNINTIIGNNTPSYSGDGGTAVNAELNSPAGAVTDAAGDIFIADSANSAIREVVAGSGDIQTVAGSMTACSSSTATCGDGGLATSAQLNTPQGVFLDAAGNIYIADTEDNRIRAVNAGAASIIIASVTIPPGDIATVAGNGTGGYSGDSGPAISAELSNPYGVFVDAAGNIFIADTGNNVIREVSTSGTITTVAGNNAECSPATSPCGDGGAAISAQLSSPAGVFLDAAEDIFIADTFDNRIREVTASNGVINTVAGNGTRGYAGDGAPATQANLDSPYGLSVDLSGDIFIADSENSVIREVVAANGNIETIAGNNTPGFSGDGLQATSAELNSPSGVFAAAAGNLFVADTENERIRELVPGIFVTVTPNPVNVVVGAQLQFTAAVTGTSNTAVTWQVSGVAGGNSTVGTISTTGLYQAPATVPAPATVTITALSAADGTTSGSAQATIVTANNNITVAVSSGGASQVYTTTTQQFTATVTGGTSQAVNWYVEGSAGGNATFGTIDGSGLYTAPAGVPAPATITITAFSQQASNAFGTALIMIVTVPSAAQPAPQTISPGGTATYSLLLNENTGAPGKPITLSCSQATLPPNATCTFSPAKITPGPQAVAFSLTIAVPANSASLENLNKSRLQLYVAFLPLAGIVFAGCGRRKKQCCTWIAALCLLLLMVGCGGVSSPHSTPTNPELGTYNVKVQGVTSAQPNPVTITIVGLTVQ